ncbi:MAG: ATP-binding cassette domain-containing protein, partial [Muribaculaceae bacterium]|nr:ATP-binding cassette domain-containing protein [Muribaculaceae bacterium]
MKVAVNLLSPKLYYSTIAIDNPSAPVTVGADMTAFIGPNGAGKSLLADILEKGWNFRTNRISCSASSKPVIRKIQFSDIHSLAGLKVEYYQQRYEATANDEVPTVSEVMADKLQTERARELCEIFNLNEAADKKINFLSSGELRKLLIINTLLADNIDMLILDNPYIGLDREAREVLDSALAELNRKGDLTIVMIVANERDIHPDCTTVVPVRDMQILPPMSRADFMADSELIDSLFDFKINLNDVPLPPVADTARLNHVVK